MGRFSYSEMGWERAQFDNMKVGNTILKKRVLRVVVGIRWHLWRVPVPTRLTAVDSHDAFSAVVHHLQGDIWIAEKLIMVGPIQLWHGLLEGCSRRQIGEGYCMAVSLHVLFYLCLINKHVLWVACWFFIPSSFLSAALGIHANEAMLWFTRACSVGCQ